MAKVLVAEVEGRPAAVAMRGAGEAGAMVLAVAGEAGWAGGETETRGTDGGAIEREWNWFERVSEP